MPFRIGPMELAIVMVIVIIIFGVGKLPEIGGAVGRGIREFRKAHTGEDEINEAREVATVKKEPVRRRKS